MEYKTNEKNENLIEFNTQNGAVLSGRFFEGRSKKGIIIFPGIFEYRSSLYGFAESLNKKDFNVWVFDLNSQGDSYCRDNNGSRYCGNWDLNEMQQSVNYIQNKIKKTHGLRGIGALGNSAGGMAVGIAASKGSGLECLCMTSTPASFKDAITRFVPYTALDYAKHVPNIAIKGFSVIFDVINGCYSEYYNKISRPKQRRQRHETSPARFSALKIHDFKDFIGFIQNSPLLKENVSNIKQPILLVYGSNDLLIKMRKLNNRPYGTVSDSKIIGDEQVLEQFPKTYRQMYRDIGSKDKRIIVLQGADHTLNESPMTDKPTNHDQLFSGLLKPIVAEHFCEYML